MNSYFSAKGSVKGSSLTYYSARISVSELEWEARRRIVGIIQDPERECGGGDPKGKCIQLLEEING